MDSSSHNMTSCPSADRCSICGLHFWWRNEKAIWPKPTSKLDDSPRHRNISCNAKEFNVQIERLMFCKAIRHNATPFVCRLYHSTLRWAIPSNATLFKCTLCHSTLRWAIWRNATPFGVRCATRHYPEPFDATLHRLCTVIQMGARLFVIELFYFTISCSNSTWVTGPFIIWLDYSCLGCSVSWRKTKPSIIWPCHSFISYSILQLILKPALYLLIYLTSLYFWWWRPPIKKTMPIFFSGLIWKQSMNLLNSGTDKVSPANSEFQKGVYHSRTIPS